MINETQIDELKEQVKKLNLLLENPQPGLFTWVKMLYYYIDKINEISNEMIKL